MRTLVTRDVVYCDAEAGGQHWHAEKVLVLFPGNSCQETWAPSGTGRLVLECAGRGYAAQAGQRVLVLTFPTVRPGMRSTMYNARHAQPRYRVATVTVVVVRAFFSRNALREIKHDARRSLQ